MSITTRLKLALAIGAMIFWIPVIISFFQERSFTQPEVYFLVTFFSLSVVLMEYPTGVLGDYFSHKISVQYGYLLMSIFTFIAVFLFPKFMYFILLFMVAVGNTMVSGSDIALLHKHSNDFKKDLSDIKFLSIGSLLVGTTIGGFVGNINLDLPFIFTAVAYLAAGLIIFTIPETNKNTHDSANVFTHAKNGLNFIFKKDYLLSFIVIGVALGTMILSLKWFYNTLFDYLHINPSLWGVLASFSISLTAAGAFMARKKIHINLKVLTVLTAVSIVAIGITDSWYLPLVFMFLYSLLHGLFEVTYENELNEQISDSHRAGTLSLKSLMTRILYAFYTFIAGLMLGYTNVLVFLSVTGVVLLIIVMLGIIFYQRETQLSLQSNAKINL